MNRLRDEPSPYLRQHADNPVDWWPWGPEALAEASSTDRPLLVSIGYSACHWCHVMAHESFEDPQTAETMNSLFVNIKVDREERPDVDAVYMEALQAMTGSGGWPLTAFCTPDGRPFWTGTYFPATPTHGRPSFQQVCQAVHEAWTQRRGDLEEQAEQVTAHLGTNSLQPAQSPPGQEILDSARTRLLAEHDRQNGGFGSAPKFPQTMGLDVLMRSHARSDGDPEAMRAVERSLDAMAAGGIHDHLGGGFSRYSVDERWLVPHFEKMLYDQALLLKVYVHGWLLTGHDRYGRVASDTARYLLDTLRDPAGAFHSAEDADSEGEEGRFYIWTPSQITEALGNRAAEAMKWWGVSAEGNFEGRSILNRLHADPSEPEPTWVDEARSELLASRAGRVHPGRDDKVLTEWNALAISALAEAGRAMGRPEWVDAAVAAAEFLIANMRRADGRWLRAWQAESGEARHLALATDHAALVDAFLTLSSTTGHARWIGFARSTADQMLELFWDADGTGLFTTGHDAERLVARQKDLLDGATPSANSLAAVSLLKLAALTGEAVYRARAEAIVALLSETAGRQPLALSHLLAAVDLMVNGIDEVAVVGDRADLVEGIHREFLPGAVLAWGEQFDSPLWEGREEGLAYVCRDFACRQPTSDLDELLGQLTTR